MADTRLAQKISQIPGVGLVTISGGQKPAVRVQVNPTALSARGINLEDVRTALQQTSVNQAMGNFDGPQQAYQINGNDQLLTSQDYRSSVVVAYRNGAPVMLSDVANVIDDVGERQAGRLDEQRPGGHPQHPAPAGRQYHPGRGPHQGALAPAQDQSARGHRGLAADRPHGHDPGLGQGCPVRADADRSLGRDGDLPVPADALRDHHPERGGAALAGGHLRGDVPPGLQPEQPHPDGADDLDRVRGG